MRFRSYIIWGIPSFVISFFIFNIFLDPTKEAFLKYNYWDSLFRFGETLRIANAKFVDDNKSDYRQLTDMAISGMVSNLDRHSSYYSPSEYSAFQDDTHRRYVGIGVMIRKTEKGILITRVFPKSPAQDSGLEVGDIIVRVKGESVVDWDLDQVSSRIKGIENTNVLLSVISNNDSLKTLKVRRQKIKISSVEDQGVDEDSIGYIRLVQFSSHSFEEFKSAIEELDSQSLKGLIIDLRDNAGGLLSSAVDITDLFLPEGQLIVSIKGRHKNDIREYKSKSSQYIKDIPLVVLMNGGSASASEILGGALSTWKKSVIVGEKSFGKGSVQTIFPMDDGSGLRLTTAMYFLPNGMTIHESGIEPDIVVECSDENETRLRIQRYVDGIMNPEEFEKQFGFFPVKDLQLEKAKEYLRSKMDFSESKSI